MTEEVPMKEFLDSGEAKEPYVSQGGFTTLLGSRVGPINDSRFLANLLGRSSYDRGGTARWMLDSGEW